MDNILFFINSLLLIINYKFTKFRENEDPFKFKIR